MKTMKKIKMLSMKETITLFNSDKKNQCASEREILSE